MKIVSLSDAPKGENKIQLTLYDTTEIKKGMDRGFTNYGTEEARFIIIKKL